MATMYVRLLKKWSDWNEGDVVGLEKGRAMRVIAAGYGIADNSREAARIADVEQRGAPPLRRGPRAETAMANPVAERAVVTPELAARTDEEEYPATPTPEPELEPEPKAPPQPRRRGRRRTK